MIERLEKIIKGEMKPTDTDKRFYTHEIRELERYRNLGIKDGEVPKTMRKYGTTLIRQHSKIIKLMKELNHCIRQKQKRRIAKQRKGK